MQQRHGIAQKPLAGKSFLASFTDPHFKGRNEQYFEVFSNRSIYKDGWKADAQHTFPWRQDYAPGNWDKDRWELYNLSQDFSEANDLAAQMPEKLAEMKQRFDAAAEKRASNATEANSDEENRSHHQAVQA